MADINLLPIDERKSENMEKLRKNLSVFSTIVLFVVAAFALGTLIFFTRLISERKEIIGRIESASNKIASYENSEALLVVTKGKVSMASQLLDSRTDYVKFFETFSKIVPTDVYFTDIKFTNGKVTFTGKARTSADLAGLIASLANPPGTELVSNVSIDSLNADENRVYSFGISALIAGEEPPAAAGAGDQNQPASASDDVDENQGGIRKR